MCTCRFNYVCWRPWGSADLAEVSLHQITTAMFSRTISDTGTCFFTRRSIVVVHQLPRVSLLVCPFAHMKWQATSCKIIVCTRRGVWRGRTRESRSHVMPCYWCHPTNGHYEVVHALDYAKDTGNETNNDNWCWYICPWDVPPRPGPASRPTRVCLCINSLFETHRFRHCAWTGVITWPGCMYSITHVPILVHRPSGSSVLLHLHKQLGRVN